MKLRHLLLLILLPLIALKASAQEKFPFENEIKAFQHQDSVSFPKPDGILFIGSSSIRLWGDLEQRFPGKPIIKRGVGGSEIWQWVQFYAPYVIYPYHPKKIFVYVGENDIAAGKGAQSVYDNFVKLWDMMHDKLPEAEIYFMSIKPSPSRAKYYDEVAKANQMIGDYIKTKPKTKYIDVATPILKKETGLPDSSLFKADLLHLKPEGYDRWQKALKKYVK